MDYRIEPATPAAGSTNKTCSHAVWFGPEADVGGATKHRREWKTNSHAGEGPSLRLSWRSHAVKTTNRTDPIRHSFARRHMIKVAVTDYTFESLDVETDILAPLGCEITAWKRIAPPGELIRLVSDADHIITQFARLTADVIGAMHKARVIVR